MKVKQAANGKWYVSKIVMGKKKTRNWFWIKNNRRIGVGKLYFPQMLVGKRIRLLVEIVEE